MTWVVWCTCGDARHGITDPDAAARHLNHHRRTCGLTAPRIATDT